MSRLVTQGRELRLSKPLQTGSRAMVGALRAPSFDAATGAVRGHGHQGCASREPRVGFRYRSNHSRIRRFTSSASAREWRDRL